MVRKKERTYPELVGPRGRGQIGGGCWCSGAVGGAPRAFLSQLARAKARHEPRILRQKVQQGLEIAVASDPVMCSRRQSIREVLGGVL